MTGPIGDWPCAERALDDRPDHSRKVSPCSSSTRWSATFPVVLSIVRIVTALIFMEHGTQKLFGFPAPAEGGSPPAGSFIWFGGVLEAAGGLLLLVGLFTRPVALILSGEMAVAYWLFHAPKSVFPALNGGDAAILYCFVFLLLVFTGPGAWSLDRLIRRPG